MSTSNPTLRTQERNIFELGESEVRTMNEIVINLGPPGAVKTTMFYGIRGITCPAGDEVNKKLMNSSSYRLTTEIFGFRCL